MLCSLPFYVLLFFFFFNDTATTEIYTLSLHDALPICLQAPGPWVYRSCGRPAFDGNDAILGNQGISVGWADQYYKWLGGQYFVLDGGDGQAPVPPGDYLIRIHVNPPFVCTPFDIAHDRPVDPQGFCHNFLESNYDNNVAEVPITIQPNRPGKTGYGAGSGQQAKDDAVDDENRPTGN